MHVLMVADQRNSPSTYSYLKKLARQLEKSGVKVRSYTEDLERVQQGLGKKKPDLVHLHYHPDARKTRHVLRVMEERGIPVAVTYHEVLRAPEKRREHVQKCIERTPYAFFLSDADRAHAIGIQPRLSDKSEVVKIPAPSDLPPEFMAERDRLLQALVEEPETPAKLLVLDSIEPDRGLENLLQSTKNWGDGLQLVLSGSVPPGQGKFAKYLASMVGYYHLPVEVRVSKRRLGKRQLCSLLEEVHFAWLPEGDIKHPDYAGISEHNMLVPFLNAARTLVFAHPGHYSSSVMRHSTHLLKNHADVVKAVQHYRSHPDALAEKIRNAEQLAMQFSWGDLARVSLQAYRTLVQES